MMLIQLRFSLALMLLCLASPTKAEVEPIRIEYRADRGCPGEEAFRRQVFLRTGSARLAQASEPARVFQIDLRLVPSGASGSLVIREQDGATVARRVNGKTCKDIATVLALASALAIDPRAELVPKENLAFDEEFAEGQGAAKSDVTGDAPAAGAGVANPTGDDDARRGDPAVSSKSTEVTPSIESPGSDRTRTISLYDVPGGDTPLEFRHQFSVGPRAALGISPEAAFGAAVSYAWATSDARTAAHLGLALTWVEALPTKVSGATADFRYLTVRPMLCPLTLPLSRAVSTSPCVGAELGAVVGSGSSIPVSGTETRLWATGELSLRLDATIDGPWFAGVELGLVFPFSRYRFVFLDPEQSVYPVPAVAGAGGLHIGVRF